MASASPELLVLDVVWPRPGRRAAAHVHPKMEETWHVVSGRAGFEIDGVRSTAGPGESAVAPPGAVHLAWNDGEDPCVLRIEMRPALRWAEFTERLFRGDDPVALLAEYEDEVRLP